MEYGENVVHNEIEFVDDGIDESQEKLYQSEVAERLGMSKEKRKLLLLAIALLAVFLIVFLVPNPLKYAMDLNVRGYWLSTWLGELRGNVSDLKYGLTYGDHTLPTTLQRTFPAYIVCLVIGASLSVSGAVYQGCFRNPMASPSTLGVISGGTCGILVYTLMVYGPLSGMKIALLAKGADKVMKPLGFGGGIVFLFAFSLGAVIFTVLVSKVAGKGQMTMVTMLVTGAVVTSATSGINELIQYWVIKGYADSAYLVVLIKYANSGTIILDHLSEGLYYLIPLCVLIAVMILLSGRLNLLVFEKDEAQMLGINVERFRVIMVVLCTLMVAVSMSGAGMIGFIGLIIPNIARWYIGGDFRFLIPASAILGALFLLVVFIVPSFYWLPAQNHITPMTSLIGGILFIVLLIRYRRQRNADWS